MATPQVRRGVMVTVAICAITLLIAASEPGMADWPTSLVEMLLLPVTALLFVGCTVWSLTQMLRIPRDGLKCASPFLACAVTLALLVYAPIEDLYLQTNFHWRRAAREAIVAQVARGELKPNVGYNANLIALGDGGPSVSLGNDIVVDEEDDGTYVLFLIMRGPRHSFGGFLYVPPGAEPEKFLEFDDKAPTRLVRYGKDWYFVAN